METKKQISLEVVNSNAAGIDIGSRSHWVAVGQNAEDVKEFGVYSQDQLEMCHWLHSNGVTSIAMESTGTYWQNSVITIAENQRRKSQKLCSSMGAKIISLP